MNLTAYPEYDSAAVDTLRAREYARLDANDQVYLDYTGAGLYVGHPHRFARSLANGPLWKGASAAMRVHVPLSC